MLFIIYINDLPSVVDPESRIFLFADDTKVYRRIRTQQDVKQLQEDLQALQKWSDKWLLKFHPDKCVTMRVGKTTMQRPNYTMGSENEHMLKETIAEKDIGVTFEKNLTFDKHMQEKINKANRIMGIIRKTFEFLDEEIFKCLFKSLVRPIVEYANQVWCPYHRKHIESLENIQRRATKVIPGMKNLSYPERLQKLGLPTLAYRRARGDMIEVFKLLNDNGGYDKNTTEGLMKTSTNTSTRGHKYKLETQRARLDLRKYSFSVRVVAAWNSLPENVACASSINSFKRKLDSFWEKQRIKFDHTESLTTQLWKS